MDRIKNVMQRLQDVYHGKHQKTAIDVDLMLDYTRVMYADLLEWRKSFKEEPTTRESAEAVQTETAVTAAAPMEQQETITAALEEKTLEEVIHTKEVTEDDVTPIAAEKTDQTAIADHTIPVDVPEEIEKSEMVQAIYRPIERDEPEVKEPMEADSEPLVKTMPEAEDLSTLNKNLSGISFEPPGKAESGSVIKEEEVLLEEPTIKPEIETLPVPIPEMIPLPTIITVETDLKSATTYKVPETRKDIRTSIGINDKYLFLNELFNNKKSDYEETMDSLNHINALEDALSWIKSEVAPLYKWDKDDATTGTFYALLNKHFSTR